MKKMRKFIPAVAMLLVSAVMLSTATYAWFTMGTYATATGMSVTAESTSSMLIIDGDAIGGEKTASDKMIAFNGATNSVDLTRPTGGNKGLNLQPATHKSVTTTTGEGESAVSTTTHSIITLSDATKVDRVTGQALSGSGEKAAVEDTNYVEYLLYIATVGEAMTEENATLKATVSIPQDLTIAVNNAVTVEFWVDNSFQTEGEVEYIGKTNLLTVDEDASNSGVVDLKVPSIPVAVNKTDAGASLGDYVVVSMRVYFDGALVDEETKTDDAPEGSTYVRNDEISTAAVNFSVRFDYTVNAQ